MIKIKGLKVGYSSSQGTQLVVKGADLELKDGEFLGLTGPSGCGKSTIASAVMRILPSSGRIVSGEILLDGTDLAKESESVMEQIRGSRVSIVFQDPFTSLNPVMSIGAQMSETIMVHKRTGRDEALRLAAGLLSEMMFNAPEETLKKYPHQLSGGMRQRVCLAMAVSCGAKLLIADEPTTSLDMVNQHNILELLKGLNRTKGLSVMLITHNTAVANKYCTRTLMMKDGVIRQ